MAAQIFHYRSPATGKVSSRLARDQAGRTLHSFNFLCRRNNTRGRRARASWATTGGPLRRTWPKSASTYKHTHLGPRRSPSLTTLRGRGALGGRGRVGGRHRAPLPLDVGVRVRRWSARECGRKERRRNRTPPFVVLALALSVRGACKAEKETVESDERERRRASLRLAVGPSASVVRMTDSRRSRRRRRHRTSARASLSTWAAATLLAGREVATRDAERNRDEGGRALGRGQARAETSFLTKFSTSQYWLSHLFGSSSSRRADPAPWPD